MSGRSRGIDTYATRHCPVVIFQDDKQVATYKSISDCARALKITPAKVKHYLCYDELYNGMELDIPAESIYLAKSETVMRKKGFKKIVRIIRSDRPKKTIRKFERLYIGGIMQIRPLDTNILIEKEEEEKTSSGIILVKKEDNPGLVIGKIKAVGDKVETVKVEDRVLYQDSDTTPVTVDGKTLYIVDECNIFAIVTG